MIDKHDKFGADEFDALLDELIEQQFNDAIVSEKEYELFGEYSCDDTIDGFDFTQYTSKGTTYMIPKPVGTPCVRLDEEFMMGVDDDERKTIFPGNNHLFMYGNISDHHINFSLLPDKVIDKSQKILLALYKEGVSAPLFKATCDTAKLDACFKVECNLPDFEYGKYFLLVCGAETEAHGKQYIVMGGNVRFDFILMPHGESLQHPKVKHVAMSRRAGSSLYNATMNMLFESPRSETDVYTFCCVSDTYEQVGYNQDSFFNRKKKSKAVVEFGSRYLWVQGNYSVYALHNNEPFFLMRFHYDGDSFTLVAQEYLQSGSQDFLFAKYMLAGPFAEKWRTLAQIPGCTACKRMVASMVKELVMSNMREEACLHPIRSVKGYCLESDDERFLYSFFSLVVGRESYKLGNCAYLVEQKMTVDPYETLNEYLQECSGRAMVLLNVGMLLSPNGKGALAKIEEYLKEKKSTMLFLCGTESETRMLIESSPMLQRIMPKGNYVPVEPFTLAEQVHVVQDIMTEQDFLLDPDAEKPLLSLITRMYTQGVSSRWGRDDFKAFFNERIYSRIRERAVAASHHYDRQSLRNISVVTADDLDITFDEKELSPFETSMRELNGMVGLTALKESLNVMFNNVKFEEMRRRAGLKVPATTAHHMIFTGNPGTGKTTVAKKIGRIFHSLGMLSKGEVIVTERTQLVGRYIGETERNMQAVLEQARGNVLFIDEAYTLCDSLDDRKDFGYHVIDALLTVLSQPNPDILVIMAGYKDDMEKMMRMNKGLDGRFPYKFNFDDYSEDELMQIAMNLFARNEYVLDADAQTALRTGVREMLAGKDACFSNARWAEQLVADGIIPAMSMRVLNSGEGADRESLTLVKRCDVEAAFMRFGCRQTAAQSSSVRIGFSY